MADISFLGFLSATNSCESCFLIPPDGLFGSPRELSRTEMVRKNWRARRSPNNKNKDCGENRPIKMPPRRFPRTPPAEEAIQTNDWRFPEEDGWGCLVEEGVCLAFSATMASFATSAIEAPRLLRRSSKIEAGRTKKKAIKAALIVRPEWRNFNTNSNFSNQETTEEISTNKKRRKFLRSQVKQNVGPKGHLFMLSRNHIIQLVKYLPLHEMYQNKLTMRLQVMSDH
ncbi:hypothetical protein CR513_28277, partial [Mucuna pruriens]